MLFAAHAYICLERMACCRSLSPSKMEVPREVLVEIGDSRKVVDLSREALLDLLRKDAKGYFLLDDEEDVDGSPYILQRYRTDKWHSYVDVSNFGDIENGDKLKIIPKCHVKPKIQVIPTVEIYFTRN